MKHISTNIVSQNKRNLTESEQRFKEFYNSLAVGERVTISSASKILGARNGAPAANMNNIFVYMSRNGFLTREYGANIIKYYKVTDITEDDIRDISMYVKFPSMIKDPIKKKPKYNWD